MAISLSIYFFALGFAANFLSIFFVAYLSFVPCFDVRYTSPKAFFQDFLLKLNHLRALLTFLIKILNL